MYDFGHNDYNSVFMTHQGSSVPPYFDLFAIDLDFHTDSHPLHVYLKSPLPDHICLSFTPLGSIVFYIDPKPPSFGACGLSIALFFDGFPAAKGLSIFTQSWFFKTVYGCFMSIFKRELTNLVQIRFWKRTFMLVLSLV